MFFRRPAIKNKLPGYRRPFFRKARVGLALSGGGCKAFFALGIGQTLIENGIPIRAISGTSAGSAMALAMVSQSALDLLRYFMEITRRNRKNFYWSRLLLGREPFPHERMYRSALMSYIDVDRVVHSPIRLAFNTLRLPPDRYPPQNRWLRYRLVLDILAAFRLEQKFAGQGIIRPFLRRAAERAGLEEVIFKNEDMISTDVISRVCLASSCVPPLISYQRLLDGNYYLDGGVTRNLPIFSLPECDLVVAVHYDQLTRQLYEMSPEADAERTILYVAPERTLPITTWDYANPDGVLACYQLGLEAGERTLRLLERVL
ncbi:MAG: patatin-like phospholipase family protein [Spirochaetales bacterium]|nr:patatin-like phospholipase family protein [Leptospiraceae bacterium]MCP5480413.1 patatin-like phospholipase family protein [Spirochaetales bacterium]